jgi:V-type H+-transporting ATPase subunit C
LVNDSEYIETHLLAVPNALVKDFLKTYESLAEMVVPRSAAEISKDDEFTLYGVTTFKKFSAEFVHKAREKRWVPRDFKWKEGGKEEERKEVESLEREERKVWGEALRLAHTGYSESAMVWVHVLALRVFVETVLRYGLPLDFVCGLVQVCCFLCLSPDKGSLLICYRRRRNKQRRSKATWTQITRTWAAMLSAETRKGE